VTTLTIVLNSYGHETCGWPQLYNNDSDFATSYQTLRAGKIVPDFHLQDGLLCHLIHLCVPSSERTKLIWEVHYSWETIHFGVEKIVVVLQNHFYWLKLRQNVHKYIIYCTACTIANPAIKKQGLYTLCLLHIIFGSPSPWTTCMIFLQPSMGMIVSSWSLIDYLRWQFN
jgi:hypothetical protein